MRFRTKHKHMIDFLFPVALFFVFALSALTVILLAAKIYQSTTEHSSFNYTSRTCLSYIAEKIHQNDVGGTVSIGTFDGCDALVLEQAHGEDTYYTYIYVHENELKEQRRGRSDRRGRQDGSQGGGFFDGIPFRQPHAIPLRRRKQPGEFFRFMHKETLNHRLHACRTHDMYHVIHTRAMQNSVLF